MTLFTEFLDITYMIFNQYHYRLSGVCLKFFITTKCFHVDCIVSHTEHLESYISEKSTAIKIFFISKNFGIHCAFLHYLSLYPAKILSISGYAMVVLCAESKLTTKLIYRLWTGPINYWFYFVWISFIPSAGMCLRQETFYKRYCTF